MRTEEAMIAQIVWLASVAFVTALFAGITAKLPIPYARGAVAVVVTDDEVALNAEHRISLELSHTDIFRAQSPPGAIRSNAGRN
jgi:hypothetical protein